MSALTDAHKNSKKIQLHRASSFISRVQKNPQVDEYYASASNAIGGYWQSSQSKAVGSGLLIAEQKLLLPTLINLDKADKEFPAKVKEFFDSIETKVPATRYQNNKIVGGGLTLEIGMEVDNDLPLSEENMPLEPMDYIRYKHALGHPFVAPTKDEADGNPIKKFFIYNPIDVTRSEAGVLDLEDKATESYLSIRDNNEKVKMMLTLLGVDYRDIEGPTPETTNDLRRKDLKALALKKPAEFIKLVEDEDFEVKYTIKMLVNTEVLKRVGNYYLVSETGVRLGNEEETLEYFKDKDLNSQTLNVLQAKLQEGLKKKNKRVRRALV